MQRLHRILAAILVVVVLGFAATERAFAETKCEAAGFVRSAGQAYDRAASSGSAAAFANAAARYSDIRSISLFALGRYRKDLSKGQEAEYLRLARQFIGETLRDHGSGFRGGSLEITDCKGSGNSVVVSTRTASGTKVVFRLVRAGGGYTVADVNMKGIWLAQQMRSKFVGTISRTGSIDGLLDYLRG